MGKRTNYERQKRDLYLTPFEAILPLLPHLPQFGGTFYEPCAADGNLVGHFDGFMECVGASDIVPLASGISQRDALSLTVDDLNGAEMVITNPPWDRKILHPLIERLRALKVPCWLLFDAGWKHTRQAAPYLEYCSKIVSAGRIKWFAGMSGMDDSAWYKFEYEKTNTLFYGRN